MRIIQLGHVALGVRDMDRSLVFWRDFLGLTISVDHEERWENADVHRRAVYLRWGTGPGSAFVVLGVDLNRDPDGDAARLNQVGIHHFAFDVDDIDAYAARARDMGIAIVSKIYNVEATLSGEPGGGEVRTILFRDPDGSYVQLQQWLSLHPIKDPVPS